MDALLVITALPDEASAQAIASYLLESRLAACVSILAPCRSVYRWEGRTEQATEYPLLIKTARARYDALEAAVRERHPYELPEIVAVSVAAGLPAYLDWVVRECKEPSPC